MVNNLIMNILNKVNKIQLSTLLFIILFNDQTVNIIKNRLLNFYLI